MGILFFAVVVIMGLVVKLMLALHVGYATCMLSLPFLWTCSHGHLPVQGRVRYTGQGFGPYVLGRGLTVLLVLSTMAAGYSLLSKMV